MASISVSEKTFELVAHAAITCFVNNEIGEARELDKVARRINAALSNQVTKNYRLRGKGITWRDVPSVLDVLKDKGYDCE